MIYQKYGQVMLPNFTNNLRNAFDLINDSKYMAIEKTTNNMTMITFACFYGVIEIYK